MMNRRQATGFAACAALVMVATMAVAAVARAQNSQRFTDIPAGNWAERGAEFVVDCGIFPVKDDGSFGVNDPLTRGRLAKALYQYHVGCGADEGPTPTTVPPSDDVVVDHYWSQDGRSYFVTLRPKAGWRYCEVHLLLDGRRTGEWSNDYFGSIPPGSTITIQVFGADNVQWDTWEWECE